MRIRQLALGAALLMLMPAIPAQAGSGSDAVMDWNQIMVTTIRAQNPFAQARLAAITQVAVFEAVNAITRDHASYLEPIAAPDGASAEAAAVIAAHDVLLNYVPTAAGDLDTARAASLAEIPDGQGKDDGIAVGQAAAAALITLRSGDGASPPQFHQPASTDAGEWQPTATCPSTGGTLFHWQNLTPFGVPSNSEFRSAPPPAPTSSQYAKDFAEVASVGRIDSATRPQHRSDVARLYVSLSAVGAWNGAAQQLAAADPRSLSEHARTLAVLNMAISDGLSTSIETKYHYMLWRPETAIRAGAADGNDRTAADSGFAPFVPTPCFPSYPSAHASAGYAARVVLERVWGGGGHSIDLSHPAVSGVVAHYSSLKQITDDIDDARVFGGIHFRFDQDAGAIQGRRVGQYVFANVLAPIE
jgi:hypothetical protein